MVSNDLTEVLGIQVQMIEPPSDDEIMQSYIDDMWVNEDKKQLNENTFAKAFCEINHLQYNNGLFYTKDHKRTQDMLMRDIWETIADVGINTDVDRTVNKLLGVVKRASTVETLQANPNVVPFADGDFYIKEKLYKIYDKSPTPYRLPVSLPIQFHNIPHFHKWLHDLFYDDDIPTIQEYLGYCLVPTTRAQKALFLVGEGGTGKSRLGSILEAMLGEAMVSVYDYQEFIKDQFKLAELENCLVLYDDDLDSAALEKTGIYKKLITNELYITADRKYGQPFKFRPYTKLISCCNQMLTSAYDNTDGFYRRLLPIVVKPKAPDFVPDREFDQKLRAEVQGIVQWSLFGLNRLIQNNWVLSESERTKEYLGMKQSSGDHMPEFLNTVMDFDPNYKVTSSELYDVYRVWCRKNAVDPWRSKAVSTWMIDNAGKFSVKQSTNIPSGDGKHLRGFIGMKIRDCWTGKKTIKLT